MHLYPAIDLYEGQVVRLTRGEYEQKTVYSEHPEQMALQWEKQGAEWLHIVDLEGARDGIIKNLDALTRIRQSVGCQIQFGGGIRTLEQIAELISLGVTRVVLGTKALDQTFFESALNKFGSSIAVGMDTRSGKLQTQGWLQEEGMTIATALRHFNQYPLKTLIYTDIHKDGMLLGPNMDGLQEVLHLAQTRVILSGGISDLNDLRECAEIKEKNFEGVIIGKALYDKKFTLKEAVEIL